MKVEPGQYILWGGKLAQIIGIAGQPTAIIRYVRDEDKPKCVCGMTLHDDIHMVIGCRIWDDNAQSVPTPSLDRLPTGGAGA